MNRILNKIAEDNNEEQQILDGLKSLGFEWCSTGFSCLALEKHLGRNKFMYLYACPPTNFPTKFDMEFPVMIVNNEGTAWATEQDATFNNYDDFVANYMDMSRYEDVVH